jgi:hypothetical protein
MGPNASAVGTNMLDEGNIDSVHTIAARSVDPGAAIDPNH